MGLETKVSEVIDKPEGLSLVSGYFNIDQQIDVLSQIDAMPWDTTLKRRVQHYGWKYDYRARNVDKESELGPLPVWLQKLADALFEQGWFGKVPDQVIVNEYEPGQGIAAHIDCEPCFGNTVASISLGSSAVMDFHSRQTNKRISVFLEQGSLMVMSGEARLEWTHSIPPRKSDFVLGERVSRSRRVSLTFRTVNI